MYKNVTVFCPRCGCRTLEMFTTHSFCTECNYSPDTDHHVQLHAQDPVDDESAFEMDERSREVDPYDDDEEILTEDDDEEDAVSFQKHEELKKLKQLVMNGFLDPAELVDEYPEHFGENWYWDEEDEIQCMEPITSEYDNGLCEDLDDWSEEDSFQDFESNEYPFDDTDDDSELECAA